MLVSVVKMETVLEKCITEKQSSVMRFCWQKDKTQRIFIKKCFLFMVGSVCSVKRFTTRWQTFRWWKGWNGGVKVVKTTVKKLLCYGFRRTHKEMEQVYQCWCDEMSRNKCFSQVRISYVSRFISICELFTDSPSYILPILVSRHLLQFTVTKFTFLFLALQCFRLSTGTEFHI
jgi:hypothetical protein